MALNNRAGFCVESSQVQAQVQGQFQNKIILYLLSFVVLENQRITS